MDAVRTSRDASEDNNEGVSSATCLALASSGNCSVAVLAAAVLLLDGMGHKGAADGVRQLPGACEAAGLPFSDAPIVLPQPLHTKQVRRAGHLGLCCSSFSAAGGAAARGHGDLPGIRVCEIRSAVSRSSL